MKHLAILFLLIICLISENLQAQWPVDLSANLPICTQSNDQIDPLVITDLNGGAIILWADKRNGDIDLFAQRVSKEGSILWKQDGIPIYEGRGDQNNYMIVQNGRGGAYITWESNYHIYAQQIDANGSLLWGSPLLFTSATIAQGSYDIVSDNNEGFIAAWNTSEEWSNLLAQKINKEGELLWSETGVIVSDPWTDESISPKIVATSNGGAVVSFQKGWVGYGIYINILDNSGNLILSEDVQFDIKDFYGFSDYEITSDRLDGGIITWEKDAEIYANRISHAGLKMWGDNGIHVCQAATQKLRPEIIGNDTNGVMFAWYDCENYSSQGELFIQKIDSSGKYIWITDGIQLSNNNSREMFHKVQADGMGGFIIVWEEAINPSDNYYWTSQSHDSSDFVFIQHVDHDGNVQWSGNLKISTNPAQKFSISAVGDGSGGIIAAWVDKRNGNADIYSQRVDTNTISNVKEEISNGIVDSYNLFQNYPNPFNPSTIIKFSLPNPAYVTLKIYNTLGQEIASLISQEMSSGIYTTEWNAAVFASGTYFYRITAGDYIATKKLLLLK